MEPINSQEIFDLIRNIKDPERAETLEELKVVRLENITVENNNINILFIPTVPHCSLAMLIGLFIRVKLSHCFPKRYKINIRVFPNSHNKENEVNKQIADKERVAAALENANILVLIQNAIYS